MDRDDRQVGRLLSRREALAFLGATGGAMLAARLSAASTSQRAELPSPSCLVQPEQIEGPYFIDERLNRSDIRSDLKSGAVKSGVPLALALTVIGVGARSCDPLADTYVDVWQCDGLGIYSDADDPRFNTIGQNFLRGYQLTDRDGIARFTTIYPGWYPSRAVHVHFKIRTSLSSAPTHEFTSQLYFDDGLTDRVHALAPYAAQRGRRMRNREDLVFRNDGGQQLVLAPTAVGPGYSAAFTVGLDIG